MQSLFDYIISTHNRYNNTININNKKLIVNTEITERDFQFVNRVGTVLSIPKSNNSIIKKGDEVIVHHNVFRRWYDIHQNEKNSSSFLEENKYIVPEDQIFAYKRQEKWNSLPGYCFVKPVYIKDEWALYTDPNLYGELVYSNDVLKQIGVSKGDVVGFTPNSEYEFNIEGEKLYRILSNHITINYGPKKKSNFSG
tara:strand:+ start:485 stop:1072 length:588 start_codon:yes stop_codon:yes gene_type:complete